MPGLAAAGRAIDPLLPVDLARGAAIAAAATLCARALLALAGRRWVVALLVAWLAMPALVVAYAWSTLPGVLLPPAAAHALHLLLAALRLAPVAALVAACIPPPPLSAAGLHGLRLHGLRTWRAWACAGPGRRWLVTALVVFPLAFGEFELGSRQGIGTWAVRLFDAQAGGQQLGVTLALALPGVALQLAGLLLAVRLLRGRGPAAGPAATGPWLRACAWALLGLGSAGLLALPCCCVLLQAGPGLGVALTQAGVLRSEVLASLVFALAAGTGAWLLAALLLGLWRRPAARVLVIALLVPGLCGSLVVGLVGLGLVQLPGLRALADTPLPLVAALVVLLLPQALGLRWLHERACATPGWHQAALLAEGSSTQRRAARHLRWHLAVRRRWGGVTLLFMWAYCDLAASAILHPVDMTPAPVRLYNLMHYGQSTMLALQVAFALLAPLGLLAAWHGLLELRHRARDVG